MASTTADERGQAYALEGLLAAMLLFTALIFSMQSVILTPTTAGTVDQDVKGQLRAEAHDNLVVADERGELRDMILYWNNDSGRFAHSFGTERGYGWEPPCTRGPDSENPACETFGERLNATFTARGFTYNLFVDYRDAANVQNTQSEVVVRRGRPSSNAVTATYTVALYDDMTLTSPEDANGRTLAELDPDDFYASDVDDAPGVDPGPIYNVVEVRLVVW